MATYGTVANTPRQADDYLRQQQQKNDPSPRQLNYGNQQQQQRPDQNYNGFITQRDPDQLENGQNGQKSLTLEYGKTIKLLR